jgi:hypothetical protein
VVDFKLRRFTAEIIPAGFESVYNPPARSQVHQNPVSGDSENAAQPATNVFDSLNFSGPPDRLAQGLLTAQRPPHLGGSRCAFSVLHFRTASMRVSLYAQASHLFRPNRKETIMKLINRRARKIFSLLALATIAFALTLTPAKTKAAANEASEQVIFSGVAFTNDGALKVGFWIWCMPEANSPIYTGACRGSVLIYGQDSATGVAGFVVENPDGTYVARVFALQTNFLVAAIFHNVAPEPAHGPNNLVQFGVLTPLGNSVGVATDAVVNVTGPGE